MAKKLNHRWEKGSLMPDAAGGSFEEVPYRLLRGRTCSGGCTGWGRAWP